MSVLILILNRDVIQRSHRMFSQDQPGMLRLSSCSIFPIKPRKLLVHGYTKMFCHRNQGVYP